MASKRVKDETLATRLDAKIRKSVGWIDSRLALERTEVTEFYEARRPEKSRRGQSSYISTDVYDSVEAMHAQLLETFAAGRRIVSFAPRGPEDAVEARTATIYTDYVVFRQNQGFEVFSDVIKDGLMSRVGVAKVFWDEKIDWEPYEIPEDQPVPLSALQAEKDAGEAEYDVEEDLEAVDFTNPDDPLVIGKFARKVDRSQVSIKPVAPNEFGVSQRARSLETASIVWERTRVSRAKLRSMKVPKSVIDTLDGDDEWLKDDEAARRFEDIDSEGYTDDETEDTDEVWVYECYVRMDLDGKGVRLWKVTKVGNYIADKEPIKYLPFVAFVPIRYPHRFWGANFAHRVIPVQKAKTVLTRGILDHTVMSNNPRWMIVNGTLQNPKELFDPRLGGGVNVNRPDGILPLPQQPLNPFVFQTLQLLDYDNEDTTGVSRLSQGLNKDAVSKQNSAALVEQLTSNSQTRQKIIARNFAYGFLIPLFRLVYQLVVENEARQQVIDVAGTWVQVDPNRWCEERDVVTEMHLGYGEHEKKQQMYVGIHQMFASDPAVAHMYTPDKRYYSYQKILECGGVPDIQSYLTPPNQAQPPPPNPEVVLKQEELKLKQAKQALDEKRFALEAQERTQRLELEKAKEQHKQTMDTAEYRLSIAEHEHDVEVDNAEVAVMQQQAKTAEKTAITAMASPNS